MRAAKILAALSWLDVDAKQTGTRIDGFVPGIEGCFHLGVRDVVSLEQIAGPNGEPAVRFGVRRKGTIHCFIATPTDVIFEPADSASQLDSNVQINVADAPPLIAYSEMIIHLDKLARSCEGDGSLNLDAVGANLLLFRCSILGAVAFGLRPVGAMALWLRAWDVVKDDIWLPPFRSNPKWDELENVARSRCVVGPSNGA